MRVARSLSVALVLVLSSAAFAQDLPECIRVEAVARWGASAYNHIVRIENGCDRRARCRVATNVNPEVQTVEIGSAQTTEVLTFRGSPASTFTPQVTCELLR